MPCRDAGEDRDHLNEVQNRLDRVTRLLCAVMKTGANVTGLLSKGDREDLCLWWAQHQAADRQREEEARVAEEIRKSWIDSEILRLQAEKQKTKKD